jgi:hypothetical protein
MSWGDLLLLLLLLAVEVLLLLLLVVVVVVVVVIIIILVVAFRRGCMWEKTAIVKRFALKASLIKIHIQQSSGR